MRITGKGIGCIAALLGTGCPYALRATPPGSPPNAATHSGSVIAGFGPSVAPAALAALSGGSNVTQNISINGNVSNISTENVSTGMNWIGGGAFGNAAGLPMVIQNSGNSVLIQNATVVNVQLQP
jgi:hypothetical protein